MKIQSCFDGTQLLHKIRYNIQSTLLEMIETIFEDITIYNEQDIYKLISSSPKGFIKIEDIIKLPLFKQFLQKNVGVYHTPDQIMRQVNQKSKKLIAVNYMIRRREPFVDRIKNKEYFSIYIECFPHNTQIGDLYNYFRDIVGNIYKMYFKQNEKWTIIIIDNVEPLMALKDKLFFKGQKLNVKSSQQTLTLYTQSDKFSTDFTLDKLYENKNKWKKIDFIENYEENYSQSNRQIQQAMRQIQGQKKQYPEDEEYGDEDQNYPGLKQNALGKLIVSNQ